MEACGKRRSRFPRATVVRVLCVHGAVSFRSGPVRTTSKMAPRDAEAQALMSTWTAAFSDLQSIP